MSGGGPLAVRVRVVWVPERDGARRGRVVVHRSVAGGATGELWLSEVLAARELLDAAHERDDGSWRALLLGRPVARLPVPVLLRPGREEDLDLLARGLAGCDPAVQRPLLLATAEVHGAALVSARVVRFVGDVLAHAVEGVLAGGLPGLELGKTTVGGSAAAAHEAGSRLAADAWIALDDVAHARHAGNYGSATVVALAPRGEQPVADAEPGALLAEPDVRRLVVPVLAAPGSPAPREALVSALEERGWIAEVDAVDLDLGTVDGGVRPVLGTLDGLLALAVRTAVGPRVVLVPPSPVASALLRSNGPLAAALAEYVAPGVAPAEMSVADRVRRRRELRAALRAAAAGAEAPDRGPARGGGA